MSKILIFEGNTRQKCEEQLSDNIKPYYIVFQDVVNHFTNNNEYDVMFPCDTDYPPLTTETLQQYDYIFITGSGVSCSASCNDPIADNFKKQMEFIFNSNVPCYGSCWGMQVACNYVGLKTGENPNGIEVPLAHNITLTKDGENHPMFNGRTRQFDAFCIHRDIVFENFSNSEITVLASNKNTTVQAVEIKHNEGIFWGTQYHPEILEDRIRYPLKNNLNHYKEVKLFKDNETVDSIMEKTMANNPDDLKDYDNHAIEIKNFLNYFKK